MDPKVNECKTQMSWIPASKATHLLLRGWIVTLIMCTISEALYHLPSIKGTCHVSSLENQTVDLLCYHNDLQQLPGTTTTCSLRTMRWTKLDTILVKNISESGSYGIWEGLPGFGNRRDEHVALLRLRSLKMEDLASYQCHVTCQEQGSGVLRTIVHQASVCMQHSHPDYAICSVHVGDNQCVRAFWSGYCDPQCDSAQSFYDGFDCIYDEECNMNIDTSCLNSYANGVCDNKCNMKQCAWDGGDCIAQPLNFVKDTIVLTLPKWYHQTSRVVDLKYIGRSISKLLRTIARVLPDDWPGDLSYRTGSSDQLEPSWHKPHRSDLSAVRHVYIRVDNTNCKERCFSDARDAARYIALALHKGWDPGIQVTSVGVLTQISQRCSFDNSTQMNLDASLSYSSLDNKINMYSYSFAGNYSLQPPLWAIIAAVIGGICIIVLLIIIVVIIIRIRKMNTMEEEQQECEETEMHRIRCDKHSPRGTDV